MITITNNKIDLEGILKRYLASNKYFYDDGYYNDEADASAEDYIAMWRKYIKETENFFYKKNKKNKSRTRCPEDDDYPYDEDDVCVRKQPKKNKDKHRAHTDILEYEKEINFYPNPGDYVNIIKFDNLGKLDKYLASQGIMVNVNTSKLLFDTYLIFCTVINNELVAANTFSKLDKMVYKKLQKH